MDNLTQIAKKIIQKNIYLTLATSAKGKPWASPLFYAFDRNNNFYFVSEKTSLHVKNLKANPRVSCAIFNSQQSPEVVNGLQIKAQAKEVGLKELHHALFTFYKKPEAKLAINRFKNYKNPLEYLGRFPFRMYKIIPEKFYILDPQITKRDKRIEVKIN